MPKLKLLYLTGIVSVFSIYALSQTSYKDIDYWTAYGIFKAFNYKGINVSKAAQQIEDKYPGDYNVNQICAVFNYLFRNWKYRPDPNGMEYFEDGDDVIESVEGDCDDYAIGMVSLILAIGGDARVVCVSGHAFPEVYIGKYLTDKDITKILSNINSYYENKTGRKNQIREINYHKDYDNTYWMNLDWQSEYPGGKFHEYDRNAQHLVIYSDGTYRKALLNKE